MGCSHSYVQCLDKKKRFRASTEHIHSNSVFDDSYHLLGAIGSGSSSIVHEAFCRTTRKRVAVKVIKKSTLRLQFQTHVFSEARILCSMDHPNIIKILDFIEDDTCFYIVTELLLGGNLLNRIVKMGAINEKTARILARSLFRGVDNIHSRNIVHRDLKPENLLLSTVFDNADIKIADFGLAREINEIKFNRRCGSLPYMSPEVLDGKSYGKPTDMWSCGVVLFILLCGKRPFCHENVEELSNRIRNCSFEFDSQYWKVVSAEAQDLITQLLVVSAEKRMTAQQALNHPWIRENKNPCSLLESSEYANKKE